ncbi:MAG: CHRD domain-containing protein [Hymenobacteraceae bacterium]|nr:CHRD domain-containing protein [Hymenobacteraceae bacterium]
MMNRPTLVFILLAGLAVAACKKDDDKQIAPTANLVELTATIDGSQQVPLLPPDSTTATGTFAGTFNRDTKVLKYTIVCTGFTLTSAHLHLGGPGHVSAVKKTIFNDLTSPIEGEVVLNDAQIVDSLLNNRTYINLHSARFQAGGEIRGNVRVK